MNSVRVKICCIQDVAEAEMALAAGAWALGLVAEMPSGQGPIGDDSIAEIALAVKDRARTFLLTCRTEADDIIEHHQACRTNTLQLVDHVAHDHLKQIRSALPDVELVQVIHVTGPDSVDEALDVAPLVDHLLLDSGNPDLAIKELGGTGRTHDWNHSRRIVQASPVPVYLAGGLRPGNVAEAIRQVGPWGVDLCSGLRNEEGRLVGSLLEDFMSEVRQSA